MIEKIDFGLSDYRIIWEKQKELFESLLDNKKKKKEILTEYLLFGEHNPVYTLGFHGDKGNMLINESTLLNNGVECIRIERGGDITYHAPGQLIVYPIIDLERYGFGIKDYMNFLEDCVIELLDEYGILGKKNDNAIGIWIDSKTPRERKICAMGVRCRRFITMHGLALNVNIDLSGFSAINPCGFVDKGVTSVVNEIHTKINFEKLKKRLIDIIIGGLNSRLKS